MITTLVGSLLGFGSSFLPKVMDYFQDKQDKAHELAMQKEARETQLALGEQKLQAAIADSSIREIESLHREQSSTVHVASRWLANLSGSIRPVITYLFAIEYLLITWAIAYLLLSQDGVTVENLKKILDEEFMGLLASMLSFWFGARQYGKKNFTGGAST